MIRVLFFLVLIFVLGVGFAWLAERPGELVMTVAGVRYEVTLMVAAVAIVAVVAAVMIVWWILKSIWNSPRAVSRYFRARKRDRGYQSLSTGMIAAGAGDAVQAHDMAEQASKLLNADQEPLLHLLEAQALLLDGDHEAARKKFEAMLEDPETEVLALRGLYLEAQRLKDPEAARHYAERAAETAPQLAWAANASLEMKTADADWDGALGLLEKQKSAKRIEKTAYDRRRAVLLTAKAMALLQADPAAAKHAGLEANKLAPDLVPAAVTAAEALFRLNDLRKGSRLLEAVWKKEPHPDVAEAFVHARSGDSAADRMKRARRLQSIKQNHRESMMAVARAAVDAGEFDVARESVESVLRNQPSEGAYLLLADIEERQTGDQGRIRHWLSAAVRAPRDAAWTADGYVSETWAPVSPVTGRLDAFEWRVPVERLGPLIEEAEFDPAEVPVLASAAEKEPEPVASRAAIPAPPVETVSEEPEAVAEEPEPAVVEEEAVTAEPAESEAPGEPEPTEEETQPEDTVKAAEEPETKATGNGKAETSDGEEKQETPEEEAVKPRQPDDPGVDPDKADDESGQRFRLF